MDSILSSINVSQILTAVVSFVLGIGAVNTFLHKYLPVTKKYVVGVAAIIEAAEDDKVTPEEWDLILSKFGFKNSDKR